MAGPTVSLDSVVTHFESLPDPRHTRNRHHLLVDVSRYLSGKRFAKSVRGHWAIENALHWVLDVTFNEDQSRARERKLADNLSWLRRFGISLLKQHPSKESIKGKSQIAGWSNDFLLEVLVAQRT